VHINLDIWYFYTTHIYLLEGGAWLEEACAITSGKLEVGGTTQLGDLFLSVSLHI
jgi:hypothetical protein